MAILMTTSRPIVAIRIACLLSVSRMKRGQKIQGLSGQPRPPLRGALEAEDAALKRVHVFQTIRAGEGNQHLDEASHQDAGGGRAPQQGRTVRGCVIERPRLAVDLSHSRLLIPGWEVQTCSTSG